MYLVKNSTNEILLEELDKKFISRLLNLILEAKKSSTKLLSSPYYLSASRSEQSVLEICLRQIIVPGKRKKDKLAAIPAVRLIEYCEEIVKNLDLKTIEFTIKLYSDQKNKICIGSYAIREEIVHEMFHKLFTDFLYTVLFDNANIWLAIGKSHFSRTVFHDNFKKDNGNLSVCPYCDLDTIVSSGTHEVEHFLPKSKFPLIALFSRNLFSACMGCNRPGSKGAKVVKKITSPYCLEIGEKIGFNFLSVEKKIEIFSNPKNDEIVGYLELVNLPARYEKEHVWNFFEKRKSALFESLQGRKFVDSVALEDYVKAQQDGVPLKYAIKYWIKKFPEYC